MAKRYLRDKDIKLKWHRVGLLTGISPMSSEIYYSELCDAVNLHYHGVNYPQFATENINFDLIKYWMKLGEWGAIEDHLVEAMLRLEGSGVEAIAICSTTMHRIFDHINDVVNVPIIHIGDCAMAKIAELGLKQVGFIGTSTAMSENFILDRLRKSGAEIFLPDEELWDQIDRIILNEFSKELFLDKSNNFIANAITSIRGEDNVQGIVLGCAELSACVIEDRRNSLSLAHQQVRGGDKLHFLDISQFHVEAIAKFCCSGELPKI